MTWVLRLLALIQLVVAVRFLVRLIRSLPGGRIDASISSGLGSSTGSVIIPVLNEAARIEPCLRSIMAQGFSVSEILVIDGGSRDDTRAIVGKLSESYDRVRLIPADPIPDDWNGKAHGLQVGLESSSSDSAWVVTVDADVRCSPDAVERMIQFAESQELDSISVACHQRADTLGLSMIHPSMLATLVYRFGVPAGEAVDLGGVQANGQLCLYRRDALIRTAGFSWVRDSTCEDVTLARHLFLSGERVGFYEAPGLAETEMYASGVECARNWPRSLTLRDRIAPASGLDGLVNLIFLQVAPGFVLGSHLLGASVPQGMMSLNRALFATRIGILLGTRRAYSSVRWTYWLSPMFDPATLVVYLRSLLGRRHVWRGRQLVESMSG